MQAQESDLTEVTSDKQKQGVSVMSKTEVRSASLPGEDLERIS